jgi:hypothetical protein
MSTTGTLPGGGGGGGSEWAINLTTHLHPPPSTAEVQNGGAIPPFHHTSPWRGASSVEHRDNGDNVAFHLIDLDRQVV